MAGDASAGTMGGGKECVGMLGGAGVMIVVATAAEMPSKVKPRTDPAAALPELARDVSEDATEA